MIFNIKEKLKREGRVLIKVRVRTKAGRTGMKEVMDDGAVKMDIRSIPVEGAANNELIRYLSKTFEVLPNNVIIKKGLKNKNKIIEIFK